MKAVGGAAGGCRVREAWTAAAMLAAALVWERTQTFLSSAPQSFLTDEVDESPLKQGETARAVLVSLTLVRLAPRPCFSAAVMVLAQGHQ